jgi:hypothetical protein
MSLKLIDDFNNSLFEKYGVGVDKIELDSCIIDRLLLDIDSYFKYHTNDGSYVAGKNSYLMYKDIVIMKSHKSKIKETETKIAELQETLAKLKGQTNG